MDKRTRLRIQRDAEKTAKELAVCSDAKYDKFIKDFAHNEVQLGKRIARTSDEIKKLEATPKTRGISDNDKLAVAALGCVATAVGVTTAMSVLGHVDSTADIINATICAVAGGGLCGAVAQFYDKKVVSNTFNSLRLHAKKKKKKQLTQQREERKYFLDALDYEMQK